MSPTHHPPDEWLLEHVSGTQSEGLDLLVAAHATLCPMCRDRIDDLTEAAGALLANGPEHTVPGLDALLASLPEQDTPEPPPATEHGLPAPFIPYVGTGPLAWRFVAPGAKDVDLGIHEGAMPVRLLHLRGGMTVPTHNHPGLERQLVLSGGYDDDDGTYVVGDVGIGDASKPHRQRIHRGEPCIALVIADHPITPVGVKSRVLSWFFSA